MALILSENTKKRMILGRFVSSTNITRNMIGIISIKSLFNSTAVLAE